MKLKLIDKDLFSMSDSVGKLNLFNLVYPIVLQTVISNSLGFIHSILLSNVSENAVAGVSITNYLIGIYNIFLSFVYIGCQILVSYELGKGSRTKIKSYYGNALLATVTLAVTVGLLLIVFAHPIISLYGLEEIPNRYAVSYFRIRIIAIALTALLETANTILRCFGKTLVIMVNSMSWNIINVINCIVIVKLNISVYNKVVLFALSAVTVTMLQFIISFIFSLKFAKPEFKVVFDYFKEMAKLGAPGVLGLFSYHLSMSIVSGFISHLGTATINANVYCGNIVSFSVIFSYSIRQANSIMLGRLFGRNEIEKGKRFVKQNAVISVFLNLFMSILAFALSDKLMHLFTNNTEIISISKTVFVIDIIVEAARGFSHIYGESALIVAKDTVFAATTSIVLSWGVCVLFSFIVTQVFGLGLSAIWCVYAATEAIKGLILFVRWKSNKWQKKISA